MLTPTASVSRNRDTLTLHRIHNIQPITIFQNNCYITCDKVGEPQCGKSTGCGAPVTYRRRHENFGFVVSFLRRFGPWLAHDNAAECHPEVRMID